MPSRTSFLRLLHALVLPLACVAATTFSASACAHATNRAFDELGQSHDESRITQLNASTAYDLVVRMLNRLPTRPVRGGSTSFQRPQEAMVVIDGIRSELTALRTLPASEVEEIEILQAREGTQRYGMGATNGVIVVRTKKGGAILRG